MTQKKKKTMMSAAYYVRPPALDAWKIAQHASKLANIEIERIRRYAAM